MLAEVGRNCWLESGLGLTEGVLFARINGCWSGDRCKLKIGSMVCGETGRWMSLRTSTKRCGLSITEKYATKHHRYNVIFNLGMLPLRMADFDVDDYIYIRTVFGDSLLDVRGTRRLKTCDP